MKPHRKYFLIAGLSIFLFVSTGIAYASSSTFLTQAQKFINQNCNKKFFPDQTALLCYLFNKSQEQDIAITNINTTLSPVPGEIADLEKRVASLEAQHTTTPTPTTTSGLISWWKAEGNANDAEGINNGTLENGVTFASGEIGQAFSFNGSSYVQAPTAELPTGNSDRTLALWVKINSFLDNVADPHDPLETFFAGYGTSGSSGQTYQLGTAGNVLYFSQWGNAIFGSSLQTGVWYHVVVENQANNVTLYVNGTQVATGTLTINTPANTQFYMGTIPGALGDTRKLNGLEDEVKVFNRALSPAEILALP